ncbi:hypothetical protein LWI29_003096 [Acer saccharum]|uniref:Uncharacterized protein n=1 Tax=Acer saccharum TaxID=4024 RepID=A0AA39SHH2_ACESA|nr:hypothetical protein LWI29_003096 [Acer saccharum]
MNRACFSVAVIKTLSKVLLRGKYIISLLRKHKTGMLYGLCDAAAEYDRERKVSRRSTMNGGRGTWEVGRFVVAWTEPLAMNRYHLISSII